MAVAPPKSILIRARGRVGLSVMVRVPVTITVRGVEGCN